MIANRIYFIEISILLKSETKFRNKLDYCNEIHFLYVNLSILPKFD